jgi:type IV secretory pathway VirB2 component (pilin)
MAPRKLLWWLAAASLVASPAAASSTSGLPVDSYLHNVVQSFVGAVAFSCILIGIVVAGARLMRGGDLNAFFGTLVLLVVLAGLTVGAPKALAVISSNGAVIGPLQHESSN